MNNAVLELLAEISLETKWRGDCPVCGGKNTFTVSKENGNTVYFCFRNSCHAKGHVETRVPLKEIISYFEPKVEPARVPFEIPDSFVRVNGRPEVIEYLRANNCLEAFKGGLADIRYDVKQNRVAFMIYEGEICYGAIGRALERGVNPKWYRYGEFTSLYYLHDPLLYYRKPVGTRTYSHLVLVEDCASACAGSSLFNMAALLGTKLSVAHKLALTKYDTVYIALDKDASSTALDIQKELLLYVRSPIVVLLEKDLKYCSKAEIERIFDDRNI